MLALLDDRTFTSGDDTAKFIEHLHEAMRKGVHINCIHEFPSVVGPPRHECEFGLMFNDDWTPAHLTGGPTNLYKEIAFALKGVEWRQPGLVAVASKIATSAGEHKPIAFEVPDSYEPKKGPNKWKDQLFSKVEALVKQFDFDRDYVVNANELHWILKKTDESVTVTEAARLYQTLLETHDANHDGQLSIDKVATYLSQHTVSSIKAEGVSKLEDVKLEAAAMVAASGSAAAADVVLGEAHPLPLPALAAPSPAEEAELSVRLKALFSPKEDLKTTELLA